jgi:H+/Na+-translocating ferredoxin:NAD+ oxidoreductase subunit B
MPDDIFDQLAAALDRLPNAFPRTESGVELAILRRIFSEEEASLAARLDGEMTPINALAERLDLPVKELRSRLLKMARRGLVWFDKEGGKPRFRLAPFIVGIYEAQWKNMDHDLAHLVESYLLEGGAEGIMKLQPALHRVIPAHGAVKSEWILPYDDVRAVLEEARTFRVQPCICRTQKEQLGRECDFPLDVCLIFSTREGAPGPEDISREEALAILDRSEEAGLVHSVSNVAEGLGYVCNCCGCCCSILRGINEWGLEKSVAAANYYAVVDAESCVNCGLCAVRCQVNAISEADDLAVVAREKCIGCGVCASKCPVMAITLERKPDEELVHPPKDFGAWEQERAGNR